MGLIGNLASPNKEWLPLFEKCQQDTRICPSTLSLHSFCKLTSKGAHLGWKIQEKYHYHHWITWLFQIDAALFSSVRRFGARCRTFFGFSYFSSIKWMLWSMWNCFNCQGLHGVLPWMFFFFSFLSFFSVACVNNSTFIPTRIFYSEDVFRIGCRNVSPNNSPFQDSMIIFNQGMSLLGSNHCILLRTFAPNFSNIDFFLEILPLKDDELVMSEM